MIKRPHNAPRETESLRAGAPFKARIVDGLGKRYAFKVGTSVLLLPLNLGSQLIITRTLGPAAYGSYSYLTGFFTNLMGFFDSGSSSGFYAKLCSRPSENGLKLFYWCFAAVSGAAVTLVTTVFVASALRQQLWPEQPPIWIMLSLFFALVTWCASIGEKIVDAHALTARGEPWKLVVRAVGLLALGILFLAGKLGFANLLICQIGLLLLQLILWQRILRANDASMMVWRKFVPQEISRYTSEFWTYSHPIAVYMLVSAVAAVADRWLLQYYAGSEQQGFYGISYQVAAFCLLFTSAMVPLLAREFAEAHQHHDHERMRSAFRRNIPRFYSLAAIGGVFMASQADRVSVLIGGAKFGQAALPMALMCLYPIHQTYGQLSGSLFFATGNTRLYRNIGLITTAIGMVLSYLLLAPTRIGGIGLGSAGLAYKMLVSQFVTVNVQLWFNCRSLELSFAWFLGHQCLILALLGAAVAVARAISISSTSAMTGFLESASGYLLLVGLLAWFAPRLLGFSREQVRQGLGACLRPLARVLS